MRLIFRLQRLRVPALVSANGIHPNFHLKYTVDFWDWICMFSATYQKWTPSNKYGAQQIDLVDVFSVAEGPLWVECLWRVECDSLKTPSQLLATASCLVRTQVLWSAYGYGSKKRWFSFSFKRISSSIYRDITIFLVRWVEGSWFFPILRKCPRRWYPSGSTYHPAVFLVDVGMWLRSESDCSYCSIFATT